MENQVSDNKIILDGAGSSIINVNGIWEVRDGKDNLIMTSDNANEYALSVLESLYCKVSEPAKLAIMKMCLSIRVNLGINPTLH